MAYPENRIGLPTGRWWGAMSRQAALLQCGDEAHQGRQGAQEISRNPGLLSLLL
jgi:hypothetical protein